MKRIRNNIVETTYTSFKYTGDLINEHLNNRNTVVTLASVSEGSEEQFLVKGVFSPISPCLGNICNPLILHYYVVNPRLSLCNLFFYVYLSGFQMVV